MCGTDGGVERGSEPLERVAQPASDDDDLGVEFLDDRREEGAESSPVIAHGVSVGGVLDRGGQVCHVDAEAVGEAVGGQDVVGATPTESNASRGVRSPVPRRRGRAAFPP